MCESHLRCGTFIPNLSTLGLWHLELFAMYATDGQTDRRTDKSKAYCPFIIIIIIITVFIVRGLQDWPMAHCSYGVEMHMKIEKIK